MSLQKIRFKAYKNTPIIHPMRGVIYIILLTSQLAFSMDTQKSSLFLCFNISDRIKQGRETRIIEELEQISPYSISDIFSSSDEKFI